MAIVTAASRKKGMTKENFFDFGGNPFVIRARIDRLVGSTDEVEIETKILLFYRAGDEHGNTYVGVVGYKHVSPERDYFPIILDRTLGVMKGDAKEKILEMLKSWERSGEHSCWWAHRPFVAVEVENGFGYEMNERHPILSAHLARMHGAIGALLRASSVPLAPKDWEPFSHAWMVCHAYYGLGKMISAPFAPARERRKPDQTPMRVGQAPTLSSLVGI